MHPDDLAFAYFAWDDPADIRGNTWHIAPTGISQDEVEAVVRDTRLLVSHSRSSGLPCKIGPTDGGRLIFVSWRVDSDNPPVVAPVTAYYVS